MAPKSFKLNHGPKEIPSVGLGTWQAPPGEVGKAVTHALKSGYRHIDGALCYQVSVAGFLTPLFLILVQLPVAGNHADVRTRMKSVRESRTLVSRERTSSSCPRCKWLILYGLYHVFSRFYPCLVGDDAHKQLVHLPRQRRGVLGQDAQIARNGLPRPVPDPLACVSGVSLTIYEQLLVSPQHWWSTLSNNPLALYTYHL